jgi:hypothetical protein
VGLPTNILHKVHVDKELSWSGDAFELSSKLGTGYSALIAPHTHTTAPPHTLRHTRSAAHAHALTVL